ncbi:TMP55 [Giardia lamblia P15]|uniref:TMP55 n=1 Tax=Giardia intestinalis (strain P15) TaxID=658858 RepID=E1EZ38_GIAIA|nr:TMP55 [Giardia lamblia P15]
MCTLVLLLGLNLAILAAQKWPHAAVSATYLLDLHGVIEGDFLVPELASFTKRHGPTLTPLQKDSLTTNLLLYHPNLYFLAKTIATQNGIGVHDVMYYSLVVELLQDDFLVGIRGSEGLGGYLAISQSLGQVCNSSANPLCIDFTKNGGADEISHWRSDITKYFREATFLSARTGQVLSQASYMHGTLNTQMLALKDYICARLLGNTSTTPYLIDFPTLDKFIEFTHNQFMLINGRRIPLAWRLTELLLQQDSRVAYLEGHFYSLDKAHVHSSSLSSHLLSSDGNALPYYLASLVATQSTFKSSLTGVQIPVADLNSKQFSSTSSSYYFYQAGCTNSTIEKCRALNLAMKNKLLELKDTSTLVEFSNAIKIFPIRTTRTYAITTSLVGDMYRYSSQLQKCTEIYDAAKKPVGCTDPPVPTNWAVVIGSLLIIGLTITAWVYGFRFSKKLEAGAFNEVQKKLSEKALAKEEVIRKNREKRYIYKEYIRHKKEIFKRSE